MLLVHFNPNDRASAKECLKMPIFDSIRCKDLEREASELVTVNIDVHGTFDYENG